MSLISTGSPASLCPRPPLALSARPQTLCALSAPPPPPRSHGPRRRVLSARAGAVHSLVPYSLFLPAAGRAGGRAGVVLLFWEVKRAPRFSGISISAQPRWQSYNRTVRWTLFFPRDGRENGAARGRQMFGPVLPQTWRMESGHYSRPFNAPLSLARSFSL